MQAVIVVHRDPRSECTARRSHLTRAGDCVSAIDPSPVLLADNHRALVPHTSLRSLLVRLLSTLLSVEQITCSQGEFVFQT